MPKCDLCGRDAGLLRKRHKECQQKLDSGSAAITSMGRQVAITGGNLEDFAGKAALMAKDSFVNESTFRTLLLTSWQGAVSAALEDDVLTEEEEAGLVAFKDYFALAQSELDSNGAYSTVVKAGVIRDLLEGKLPERVQVEGQIPFNFQKSESLLWFFNGVDYLEERTRTRYQGGYSGASVRVAKGLYYRVGGFRGNPVITAQLVHVATGQLGVTQKHLYFAGGNKAFRIAYTKIVAFTPYSDGLGVQRDASTARPQIFKADDGWFLYNLVTNLARMSAA